jgi:hypothetical protein
MAIRHAHQTALPDDPDKDVSANKWNADHTVTFTKSELNAAVTGDNVRFNSDTVDVSDITGLGSLATQNGTFSGTSSGTNTGDETAAGILAKLLTVDGAGSGLDADLLDGQSSAAFATAAQGVLAASASQPEHTHTASAINDFDAAVAANSAVAANTAKTSNATHTGDVTGATALTIAARAVTWAKTQAIATARFLGRVTSGAGDVEELTAAEVKTALAIASGDVSGLGSLATLSAAPPAGSTAQIQYNNAGTLAGATEVEVEGNQLRLEATTSLTAPAANGVKLIGRADAGRTNPAFLSQDGIARELQPSIARSSQFVWKVQAGSTAVTGIGVSAPGTTGTATSAAMAATNFYTYMPRVEYLVTTPATTAIAALRPQALLVTTGGSLANTGGFSLVLRWGPATGVATATTRAFAGLTGTTALPTDVEPSTSTNCVFMGWDAADTNVKMMHNDGSGTCTKVDLGASFPVPTVDRTTLYELALYSPKGTSQSVSWIATNLVTGATASGTISSDMPSTSTFLGPRVSMSVGGTSSVIGLAIVAMCLDPLL